MTERVKSAAFVMAGGGTGGHVMPALAVARELRARGHQVRFIGTQRGLEARLAPAEDFPIEFIEIGGLNRVGLRIALVTLAELPFSVWAAARMLDRDRPAAVFSTGGFVAGPVLLAALWKRVPVVVMEPNAIPGFTHRKLARFVTRALLSFPETARWFPADITEVTGLPVREGDVTGVIGRERQCNAAELRLHRVDRIGLGLNSEMADIVDAREPGIELIEAADGLVLGAIDRDGLGRFRTRGGACRRRALAAGGLVGPDIGVSSPSPDCRGGRGGGTFGEKALTRIALARNCAAKRSDLPRRRGR